MVAALHVLQSCHFCCVYGKSLRNARNNILCEEEETTKEKEEDSCIVGTTFTYLGLVIVPLPHCRAVEAMYGLRDSLFSRASLSFAPTVCCVCHRIATLHKVGVGYGRNQRGDAGHKWATQMQIEIKLFWNNPLPPSSRSNVDE